MNHEPECTCAACREESRNPAMRLSAAELKRMGPVTSEGLLARLRAQEKEQEQIRGAA